MLDKRIKKMVVILFLIMFVFFISCNQRGSLPSENENKGNDVVDLTKKTLYISTLAEKALEKNLEQDELLEISRTYKSLENKQLKDFFNFRDSILIQRLKGKIDTKEIGVRFNRSKDIRHFIFNQSIKLYNKPINKISEKEIVYLFNSITKSFLINGNTTLSCPIESYPLSTCEAFIYNVDCLGYSRYATPSEPDDCDYEYRFPGNKSVVIGTDWFTRQLINQWGECGIARRYDVETYETRLLFGNYGVWLWLGLPVIGEYTLKMND